MLRSKPIGWITAGTLLCLAGVALACRLKEGGEAPPEPPPASAAAEKAAPAEAEKPPAPGRLPDDLTSRPAVGELVTPAALVEPGPADKKMPEPAAAPLPPPPPPADSTAPPPVRADKDTGPPSEPLPPVPSVPPPAADKAAEADRAPSTNLLKPEPMPGPITPVSGKKTGTPEVKPAHVPPAPEAKAPDKEEPKKPVESEPAPPVTPPPGGSAPETPAPPTPPPAPPAREPSPPPAPTTMPAPPGTPLYRVRGKGESLRAIAERTLGSGDRWPEIYRLNPDLQPELIVPPGKEVCLPAEARADSARYAPTGGGQAESEPPAVAPEATRPGVRPLPVLRSKTAERRAKQTLPLTGTYTCRAEGRSLVVPREVREQLGKAETILLTPGPDRCLWLATRDCAARLLERVEKSNLDDGEVQSFRRLYFSQTEKAGVDGAGKLTLPEKLAEYAGLTGEVVLIGIDDHFELWDAARWQRYSRQSDSGSKP